MPVLRSLFAVLAAMFFIPASFGQAAQVITNCSQVLALSREAANEEHPVRIRGAVTCYVPASQLCFVQDSSAGIYVYPSPWPKELAPGTVVTVEGTTGAGRFSPIIQRARIVPTAENASVEAKRISIEQLNSGAFDCQRVELEGVVQEVIPLNNVYNLKLVTGGSSMTVLCYDLDPSLTNLVDARIRIDGVAGTFYSGDQLTGFGLFLSDRANIRVLEPAADPFSRPLRSPGKILWYSREGAINHRVHISGLVTVSWPEECFFIEDASGAVQVFPQMAGQMPKRGDLVEVAGFVRGATTPSPSIIGALWTRAGTGRLASAKLQEIPELLLRPSRGQLVATEGTVLNVASAGKFSVCLIEQSGQVARAFCNGPLPTNVAGAKVKVTGAWNGSPSVLAGHSGPGIWLASTNDLVVQSRPALAQKRDENNFQPLILGAAGLFLACGAALALSARSRTRRAELAKDAATERVGVLDKEVHRLKENRERLGRDLHDHIIQSIYAMGLNIEECRQLLDEPGKADSRLRSALGEVNGVIRELRNVIQGLETNAIQPAEFRTALKSLALMLGNEQSSRVRLDLSQEAIDRLTQQQATELVHIAREAVSNSVRHGKAATTTFTLAMHPGKLRFCVEDDGCGFDPQLADSKGYGLRNMAKRAEGLGAEFTIHSQEGTGTRIVLDIPNQKQHLSHSESHSRINR